MKEEGRRRRRWRRGLGRMTIRYIYVADMRRGGISKRSSTAARSASHVIDCD